jgi:hypothetical protein
VVDILNFYMDDSGIRYPNRERGKQAEHGYDWFSLGGILIRECEEGIARDAHESFCQGISTMRFIRPKSALKMRTTFGFVVCPVASKSAFTRNFTV